MSALSAQSRFLFRALKARFRDQTIELQVIRRHVGRSDVVCDIGANKGSFVYWLSRWCRDGRVIAFEPQPALAANLAADCRALHLRNVKVEARAVYSRSGTQDLFVPAGHGPSASLNSTVIDRDNCEVVSVSLTSLDDYFTSGERVTLLKIDVEGAELEVLKGAERILREQSPLLVFECENRHLETGTVYDVFSYLEGFGYRGSFICRGRLTPLSDFDPVIHQTNTGPWFWKDKGYCNNFVFSKSTLPHAMA